MSNICPYFNLCGGCRYQDLSAKDYCALKLKFVQSALSAVGLNANILPMIEIGAHTRRRATFAYQNGILGFNELHSHKIVPIQSCLVLTPALEKLLPDLQQLAKHLPGSGDLAVLMTDFGADVTVIPEKNKVKRFHSKVHHNSAQDVVFLETITAFCQNNSIARFVYDGDILFQVCPLPFPVNVFMQPSVEGEKVLVDLVLKACQGSSKVLDLFCGLGTFTKPLAMSGKKVLGVDITSESIDALVNNGFSAVVRDLFRAPVLPEELNGYDAVVLDPARAGAKSQCEKLAMSGVQKIVMVSCNPITFARDCRILSDAGYCLEWVQPVDQFTYSEHLEMVALLTRK